MQTLEDPKPSSVAPHNGNGARMRTDVELTGQYLLTAVDDSNAEWSRPEWAMFYKTILASTFLLIGSVWVLMAPAIPADAKLIGTILGPAAGYKLLETGTSANNKRDPGKK